MATHQGDRRQVAVDLGNTQNNMHKTENKDIPLVAEATLVKSGVVRVMELQEQGWTYVRP